MKKKTLWKKISLQLHMLGITTVAGCLAASTIVPISIVQVQAEEGEAEEEENDEYIIEDGVFYSYIGSATSFTVPSNVTEIAEEAFYGSNELVNVTIPKSVKTIGNGAFYGCESLKKVTIKGAVTIGEEVFSGCEALTTVELPKTLTSIGGYSFAECTSLTSLEKIRLRGWKDEPCNTSSWIKEKLWQQYGYQWT